MHHLFSHISYAPPFLKHTTQLTLYISNSNTNQQYDVSTHFIHVVKFVQHYHFRWKQYCASQLDRVSQQNSSYWLSKTKRMKFTFGLHVSFFGRTYHVLSNNALTYPIYYMIATADSWFNEERIA